MRRARRTSKPSRSERRTRAQPVRVDSHSHRLDARQAAGRLLDWFRRNARDLPWRRTLDPYGIWVSEIMLQQTQVRTVIPYWERWMRELPDLRALATAPLDRVLKLWEGLGYYSRARNLQRAAQLVMQEKRGVLPGDVPGLLQLPGIGRYTAGAIASIAFNQPAPLLDGNVIRVLARLTALEGNPKERQVNETLWELSGELVRAAGEHRPTGGRNCADLNQALMELGATICTPTQPQCEACPLNSSCRARALGQVDQYPTAIPRPATTPRWIATAIVEGGGRVLVRERPAGEVNAGYWEFPGVELGSAGEEGQEALGGLLGLHPGVLRAAGQLRHSITRYRITQRLYRATLPRRSTPSLPEGSWRWVTPSELVELHLTGPHRKLASRLFGG